MEKSLFKLIERGIRKNWDRPSLTNYRGATYTYKDVARKIVKLQILFDSCGIQKGDKIAICAKNSSTWGIAFLASLTYGAVVVPILHEFKPDNIHHIVNHSEAKLLFCGDEVWNGLDEANMLNLIGIFRIEDFDLRFSRDEKLTETRKNLNRLFGERYPERFKPEHITFYEENIEDLGIINYTSGTTSASKGVMLPYRSLLTNIQYTIDFLGTTPDEKLLAMLPMAHMYGLAFEFLHHFIAGIHIHFLTRVPSPKILMDALAEIRPAVIITVPLVIEKIIKKKIFPQIERQPINFMLKVPVINEKIYKSIHDQLRQALGGNYRQIIIGGAPVNREIESFLKKIKFEYTIGYGMTEFAPLLTYASWDTFVETSCGRPVDRMEIKIDSEDPEHVSGEILARGMAMMIGYYKNEAATKSFIDSEGWGHTGDIGTMDKNGNIFIKGRIKNMILGPSGQNIYPEEIEDKINNLFFVNESIVIEKEGKIIARIYPDFESLLSQNIADSDIQSTIEKYVFELNKDLPAYSQIKGVIIHNEEFEKTPKRSIKRFLYQ
ncbi:MAG: AMP-binding protein [Bacteroidales bacterium]|nr:AMP-binding protein [Bacteroidales bacterium]